MPDLLNFAQLLEVRWERQAVMKEWQEHSGDAFPAICAFLQSTDNKATVYPAPNGSDPPWDVVEYHDGEIEAISSLDWQYRQNLNLDDIVLHRFDFAKFRIAVAEATGLKTGKSTIAVDSGEILIGQWEPQGGSQFPVYLLLPRNERNLHELIVQRIARFRKAEDAAIFLTPTRRSWSEKTHELAKAKHCLLVEMAEVLAGEEESLVLTECWEEYLRRFAQMVKIKLPGNFRRKKPKKRAELMAKVEKVKKAMADHIRSARDGVVANMDAGHGARLVKFLTKTDLAELSGLKPYHITRCFKAESQLNQLYQIANNPEKLLRYGK